MAVLTEMTGCRVSPAAVSRFSLSCGGFRAVSTSSRGVEDFIRRVGKFRCRVEDFIRRVGFVLLGHRRATYGRQCSTRVIVIS